MSGVNTQTHTLTHTDSESYIIVSILLFLLFSYDMAEKMRADVMQSIQVYHNSWW